jgi:hypothetical protein
MSNQEYKSFMQIPVIQLFNDVNLLRRYRCVCSEIIRIRVNQRILELS